MCALLSGLYIGGDHEGGRGLGVCVGGGGGVGAALAKDEKKCVFKSVHSCHFILELSQMNDYSH